MPVSSAISTFCLHSLLIVSIHRRPAPFGLCRLIAHSSAFGINSSLRQSNLISRLRNIVEKEQVAPPAQGKHSGDIRLSTVGDIRSSMVKSGRPEIEHSVVDRGLPRRSNYIHNECRERLRMDSVSVFFMAYRRAADLTGRPRLQTHRPQPSGRPHLYKVRRSFPDHRSRERARTKAHSIRELVQKLKKPGRTILLVVVGKPVNVFIQILVNIVVDSGSSHIRDTNRRMETKARKITEGCWMVLDTVIVITSVCRGKQASKARSNSGRRSGSSRWHRQAKSTSRPARTTGPARKNQSAC